MKPQLYNEFLKEIRHFVSPADIYTDELRCLCWGIDASFYRLTPKIVIRSSSEQQLSFILRTCTNYGIPFTFRAAGTSLSGQSISDSVLIVAGKHWEKFSVSADSSSIRLQPGLVGGHVNAILKPLGRVFPPDPASIGSAMVGGIVCNNASGMNCGVHANSDRMLISARIILADGTVLDTGDSESRSAFSHSHPDFIHRIEKLRDKVRANTTLADRIRYKYSIKNVTGLNLRPLIAYDDPFDIIAHSIVGSEGTLAFLSEIQMRTLRDYPFRASAMVYFLQMPECCKSVVALKELHVSSSDDDIQMSNEDLTVKSAEMLDYLSLSSVDDPVFLRYKKDVDAGNIEGVSPGDYHNLTALLVETKASTHKQLSTRIDSICNSLASFQLYSPAQFAEDPAVYGKFWAIRSGIFPSVGGTRPIGTSCLIEDVAFHIEDLPEATVRLQSLIAEHGYSDACIYGHAFEGNYHFVLNQSFGSDKEVKRYEDMMHDVARLVVQDFHGSLKAEHGTGRNMAPFVRFEWGDDAFEAMKELKDIFDPQGLLNPGVIFNKDPHCFVQNLKQLPALRFDFSQLAKGTSSIEMKEGVEKADKCMECGFCEVNCLSCGLTLSSRMRIVALREIRFLEMSGKNAKLLARLKQQYHYAGNQTCATDGLCATSCPMKINTADLTHLLRQLTVRKQWAALRLGRLSSRYFKQVKQGLRFCLRLASLGQKILGNKAMQKLCNLLHSTGLPLWMPALPQSMAKPSATTTGHSSLKVVYLPSCINQTMGISKDAPVKHTLVDETCLLLQKAGYQVIFPSDMANLCCGQIWESKGMMEIADEKSRQLQHSLLKASENGRWPVLCDQSPCLHRMRKTLTGLKLYEPAEFILTFLAPNLDFHPTDSPIALHLTCSMREMNACDHLISLARLCSTQVFLPEGVGCCGFAGDRGFTHPEMNRYALRKLRPQIEKNGIQAGYSNSRTCEIGLQASAGIPYQSIVYLVNECTTAKGTIQSESPA